MDYWVYENWAVTREGKAVVHRADCSYCKNGRGCHPKPCGESNGRWRRFRSLRAAEAAAKATKHPVKRCSFCLGHGSRPQG